MVCDLTIAADNSIFGQTGPKVTAIFYFYNTPFPYILVLKKQLFKDNQVLIFVFA
jgi:1,4-dihydroxy-2-naphthoyl-CoA synthase